MLTNGQRVQWQEGGAGQWTCTGSIVCAVKDYRGDNPNGFYEIAVDKEHYLRACHSSREMHLGWVIRSTSFDKLRPL